MLITSPHNPRVKQVLALRERKQRKRAGAMVVEGYDELRLALDCEAKPATVLFCAELFGQVEAEELLARSRDARAELVEVERRVFEKMAYRENPDGWLAVFPIPRLTLDDLTLGPIPFLVVVESVEKPGNLGAILRSADAAGVDGLILCDPILDIGNPNVIRSSRGTVFSIRAVEAASEEALSWLKARNIRVVAATPEASTLYSETDLRGPVAVAVGTEREGLSNVWREGADIRARIPMSGRVNSLNVASAAALFLFEVVRQRSMG